MHVVKTLLVLAAASAQEPLLPAFVLAGRADLLPARAEATAAALREAVLARLDAPTRGRVEALVADALRADPPPTDEDRAAFDHFRRTGEVLGAAPPAAAEE